MRFVLARVSHTVLCVFQAIYVAPTSLKKRIRLMTVPGPPHLRGRGAIQVAAWVRTPWRA